MNIWLILAVVAVAAVTIAVFVAHSHTEESGRNWPWSNKSGLAKATAVLSTIFMISLGLCGMNFITATSLHFNKAAGLLMATGWLELLGMGLSLAGLILVFFIWMGRVIRDLFSNRNE